MFVLNCLNCVCEFTLLLLLRLYFYLFENTDVLVLEKLILYQFVIIGCGMFLKLAIAIEM